LKAIEKLSHIKRLHVATYQAASGAGAAAMDELANQHKQIVNGEKPTVEKFAYQLAYNLIPQVDVFTDNGYTKEEMKMVNETKKILRDDSIRVTATAVRVPVIGGHSEAVNVEFENDFDLDEVKQILSKAEGVVLQDNTKENLYPMPVTAHEKDEVFVGRLRRDETQPNTLNMWIVSDNLRKGAATNAKQNADYLLKKGLL
jgi:aspartate-semialdehyde dehydrogenase